jgi:hypothetical protein
MAPQRREEVKKVVRLSSPIRGIACKFGLSEEKTKFSTFSRAREYF